MRGDEASSQAGFLLRKGLRILELVEMKNQVWTPVMCSKGSMV